jgi:hypothetical protein
LEDFDAELEINSVREMIKIIYPLLGHECSEK